MLENKRLGALECEEACLNVSMRGTAALSPLGVRSRFSSRRDASRCVSQMLRKLLAMREAGRPLLCGVKGVHVRDKESALLSVVCRPATDVH